MTSSTGGRAGKRTLVGVVLLAFLALSVFLAYGSVSTAVLAEGGRHTGSADAAQLSADIATGGPPYAPGQVLVKFRAGTQVAVALEALSRLGASRVLREIGGRADRAERKGEDQDVYTGKRGASGGPLPAGSAMLEWGESSADTMLRSGVEGAEGDDQEPRSWEPEGHALTESAAGPVGPGEENGGDGKVRLLALEPGLSVEGALFLLRSLPWVEYAEPNYLRRALYIPDDPRFGQQWGFHNTGQVIGGVAGSVDADIDAVEAWDLERGLSRRPVVAVIDTGIDLGHPDLDGNLWINEDEVPGNGLDDDGNGYVDDRNGYNMAGISHLYQNNWAYRLGSDQDHLLFAQSITGTGDYLSSVGMVPRRIGNPALPFTISVRASLSGPDLASAVVQPSEVSPYLGTLVEKPLSSRVRLAAGVTYYLVISTSQLDASNHYILYMNYQDPENPGEWHDLYQDGSGWRYFQSSSRWERGNFDFCFRTNPNFVPRDDNGHGTHCAGIAGAETGNGTGVAGTCPGARIMALKAGDSSGMLYSADWIEALRYAVDNGARVVSMSFGGTAYSAAEQDSVNYAWSRGAVLCAAAGNTGDETMVYPAGYEHVLGVGATDNRDQVADFSTYNGSVDLSAPGVYVMSTVPTYPVAFTAYGIPLDYTYGSGTSMATPMAAGVAALMRARSPSLTPERIVELLQGSAEDRGVPGRDDYYGWGRLNARRALEAVLPPLLDSVVPASGKVGAEVVVRGSRFGGTQGDSYVSFGTERAVDYLSWSDGEIRCLVPPLAPGGAPVRVSTATGTSDPLPFTVLPFEVIAWVSGGGGSISPPSQEVPYGGTAVLDITPYAGYRITSLSDNGKAAPVTDPAGMVYRIEGLREDHRVVASFGVVVYTVSCSVSPAGSGTVSGAGGYAHGEKVTLSASPAPGYRFVRWTEGGKQVSTSNPYAFTVTSDRALVAEFQEEPAPSPASTWYLAEGCTAQGMQTYILVQNPDSEPATLDLTFMTDKGPLPGPQDFLLPGNSRATFLANAFVPGRTDVSTKVTSDRAVICERAMYGPGMSWAHDSIGVTAPASTWYLAEGCTAQGMQTYILVQNPDSEPATLDLTFMTDKGPLPGPQDFLLPGNSRATFLANAFVPGRTDVSTKVTSDRAVICERAMYGPGMSWAHDSVGYSWVW
ncbi:DUF5719 family protein [Candidatus Solincola tengchongensis]|uniref:DUF5719 family protein n=1 Tax=Candidatus Solincola tengchongensis TaxID=2900693 RepID=UPI00257FA04B|nr:DUF5719 family protein [Candidatus Solincola tengchongensis]